MTARCDFCGRPFPTLDQPMSRTCISCASRGAPDQGRQPWTTYLRDLTAWLIAAGRRKPPKPRHKPAG